MCSDKTAVASVGGSSLPLVFVADAPTGVLACRLFS